jgi:signal transduction histidine kinase
LAIADKELAFQTEEKGKRAAELVIADKELLFQTKEKAKRAAELIIAAKDLAYQIGEKKKRAEELLIADKERVYQNHEKESRAAEFLIANIELVYQNQEKEKRAAELVIANKELAFQNAEKEKRAAELLIANKELAFQNAEKEKRAIELAKAVNELQKAKKEIIELNIGLEEKVIERTAQLEAANHELESFSYSVSHDLRSPLRAINGFTQVLLEDYADKLDDEGREVMDEIISNSKKMGLLIDNLLEFSHIGKQSISMCNVDMRDIITSVVAELKHQEPDRAVTVTMKKLLNVKGDRNMLKQVFINLVSNAFKYSGKVVKPVIEIGSYPDGAHSTFYVKDNGAGFDMRYYDKLFGVFQRLHSNAEFEGTGVGLAIIQRIVAKHSGRVWAEGKVNEGACFYVSLPASN